MYNKQLDTFIVAAECGSFTKAADWLFISAPAVIKQINALEQHLNIKLFHRSPRGITLTEAGQSIYKDAVKIIKLSNDAMSRAQAIIKNQPCVIRIGNSMMNPCRPLIELWKQIASKYPKLKMQIVPYDDNANIVLNVLDSLEKDLSVLNRCEQEGKVLLTLESWADVHPFLHTIEIAWDFTMPYGIVYPKETLQNVLIFLEAIKEIESRLPTLFSFRDPC